jgi:hypothetical protein
MGVGDNALDAALAEMNRGFDSSSEKPIAVIIESLTKLATEVPIQGE